MCPCILISLPHLENKSLGCIGKIPLITPENDQFKENYEIAKGKQEEMVNMINWAKKQCHFYQDLK
jgi:hypothetical protein